jgi:hypothetical protein
MKRITMLLILLGATIVNGQTSTYNPETRETTINYSYEKRIIGEWHLTDTYGTISDPNGEDIWGHVSTESHYTYTFDTLGAVIIDFMDDRPSEKFQYKIEGDILYINEVTHYIAYLNDDFNELMLFAGYQNSEHYKFNRSVEMKSPSCVDMKTHYSYVISQMNK